MSDLISRQAVIDTIETDCSWDIFNEWGSRTPIGECIINAIKSVPSVEPERKVGHCKGCKYFEYDSMAKVGGIPLIVAHEICKRWGDGCKTSEDGYCFLYAPREREDKE